MRAVWIVPVIASILILGTLGLSQDVFAPPSEKAEKIRVDDVTWDDSSQEFIVQLSAKFGLAQAGENANFEVCTTLSISDASGNSVGTAGPACTPLQKLEGATKDSDGFIALEPTRVGWDRNGGTFTGSASVSATTELKSPSGGTVGGSTGESTSTPTNLEIGDGSPPDNEPPIITASTSPPPNANDWNNTDVVVNFECVDNEGGSGVASVTGPIIVTTEGENQLVSGTCTDVAGNSASVTVSVSLDKTPPIMLASTDPLPNANGWNNSDVLISFVCFDALSGVASVTAPITVTTEGANQQFTGTCTDNAGNSDTATVSVSLDKTAVTPIITNPFDGEVLTNNLPTISGTAEPNDSITILVDGVVLTISVSPDVTGFWTITLSEALADGGHTFSARSNDLAGNASSLESVAILIDTTP